MRALVAGTLDFRIALLSNVHKRGKKRTLTSYHEIMNYLLGTYATDEVIAEMDTEVLLITQPSDTSLMEYEGARWKNLLSSDFVYDEYVVKRIFIEELHRLTG